MEVPLISDCIDRGGYKRDLGAFGEFQGQVLDEVEIRELLIEYVGHWCCWGSLPARTWRINAVEDCHVYVGTLETFIEQRQLVREMEPHVEGNVVGTEKESEAGIWELDLSRHFPGAFVAHREIQTKIPHSEVLEKCTGCTGRGKIVCPTCNGDQEPGFYKENKMSPCPSCHARGLIAHKDGSDTTCMTCAGKGMIPCPTCRSLGLMKCDKCAGSGFILKWSNAIVRWDTLVTRKTRATMGAASVPEEVFDGAQGIQLCNMQAHQCNPACFGGSFFLNEFSSEVIAGRAPVPPDARVICERHTISVVPVTRVTMAHHGRSFSFYIIGLGREVYLKDYYPSSCCWGLCSCFNWLRFSL